MHHHFNGLKTAALFGSIFALLLITGYALGGSSAKIEPKRAAVWSPLK